MLLWVALLLAGTLKLGFLTDAWASLHLPLDGAGDLQTLLEQLVPFDATRGEEGVSVQGVVLIRCWSPSGSLRGAVSSASRKATTAGPAWPLRSPRRRC